MAENKNSGTGFVDISSSAEVNRVYGSRVYAGSVQAPNTRRRKLKLALRITSIVLAVIFMLGGALVLYAWSRMPKYKAIEKKDSQYVVRATQDETQDETPDDDIGTANYTIVQGDGILLEHEMVLNILLFGQDYSGSKDDYGRSDTMILLSIDNLHKKLKLTSFQRDTYVYIPGYGDDKINAAFSLGGEGLAIQTVEANYGIKVHKYATVDFDSFRKIIRILGGIDIDLNIQEIEYINAQIDVNHQQERGLTDFLEYDPSKPVQKIHLDGYQALWYARDRGEENLGGNPEYSFDGDDWDRTQRQRKLIETIIKYLRTKASLGDLISIVNDIGPMITTNLKKSDILFLAQHMMTFIGYEMQEMTTPTDGSWRYGHTDDGQSVIVIDDWDKVHYDVAKFIFEDLIKTKQ